MAAPAPWESDPIVGAAPAPAAAPATAPAQPDAPWNADPLANETSAPPSPAAASAPATAPAVAPEGFSDDERRQILAYVPKAKDANDLEQYSLQLTNGRAKIGNAQEVIQKRDQGATTFGWDKPTVDPSMAAQPKAGIKDAIGNAILESLDSFMPGLGTFLKGHRDEGRAYTANAADAAGGDYGPEIGGLLDTATDPSQWGDFGANLDRNAAHEHAMLTGESDGHPIASAAGQLTGAALTAPVAGEAVDAIPAIVDAAENAPKALSAAKAMTGGAVYGSGSAGPGNRVEGAVTGAAVGGATDAALPYVVPLLKKVGGALAPSGAANAEFAAAAQRQGLDYMAADLPNALKSKFATALASLSFGAIPLAKQGERNIAAASAAADRVANNLGTVADKTGAGQAAQRGAQQFIENTGSTLDNLESKIPIAAEAPAVVSNTRGALTGISQSFRSNPKLAEAFSDPRIKKFVDALTPQTTQEATGVLDASGQPIMRDVVHGGGLSWNDLRDFRTRVGQIIGQPGLTSDGAQMGQLRSLYGALSDDIRQTAQQQGPQALNAWSRWNNYARARANRIGNVVSLIMGNDNNKAPQSAFEALQRLGNERGGDPVKLAQALRSMPQDEANSVRATILSDMGDASPGQQNGHGDVFSPAQWVTKWNTVSDRAKNVLFTGEHRRALDDLATLFSGMKSSTKFANTSKTGVSVLATANAGLIWAHPVLGSLAAALEVGGGKLLASPAFARKVAATPMTVKGARAFWSRPWVKSLQLQNPAIAGEIGAFQNTFLSHANDNARQLTTAASVPDAQQNASDQQP